MRTSKQPLNPSRILFLLFTLFLIGGNAYSQFGYREGAFLDYLHVDFKSSDILPVIFNDTAAISGKKFKKITINQYTSSDSTFAGESFSSGKIIYFNSRGDVSGYVSLGYGHTTDSAFHISDKSNHTIREFKYTYQWRPKELRLTDDYYYYYNKKGQVIKDSTWSTTSSGDEYRSNDTTISVHFYTYDKAGNCIKNIEVNKRGYGNDSSFTISKYDTKNRLVYESRDWSSTIYKYDNASNLIEEIATGGMDTVRNIHVFDSLNRNIQNICYKHNTKLYSKNTTEYKNDGGSTLTEEYYSDDGDQFSCETIRKSITQFDAQDNPLSSVETNLEKGETTTTSTLDKYTFTKGMRVITDTETQEESSQWRKCYTFSFIQNKYDERGNLLEKVCKGDKHKYDRYPKITYTYNEKNKYLETDNYSACSDIPIEKIIYVYFPDGTTVKQETDIEGKNTAVLHFGNDTRLLNVVRNYLGGQYYKSVLIYEE